MAAPAGRTLFKKKDGILTLTGDYQIVTWTPNSGGPPTISLPVSNITNLQQTPETAAKVMLKIFEKADNGADPATYLFHFNTSEAKAEAKAIKDVLSKILADMRSNDAGVPRPNVATPTAGDASTPAAAGSGSAAMAFASAVNSQASASTRWFDDNQLKNDIELQQSLMKKDKSLHQTYVEAITTKPESISGAAFNSQFWSTRTNLLRAHAIEINQKKGAYNVLSTVKPRTVDGELKLNISVEQVQMIFAQHPLVKRIYNENVPKLSEADFWSRFFLSRMSKKLRGERITDNDAQDPLFDKYDVTENTEGVQSKIMAQSVPHIIDLEGNESNQGGFKGGNAKDVEMRPRANIPIVKTLNSLSEKIMANVAPSDVYDDNGSGERDEFNELALRDLRGNTAEHRIMLNVKEQNRFFQKQDSAPSENARVFATQKPKEVLSKIRNSLRKFETDSSGGASLQAAIAFEDESDSDEESQKHIQVSSRAAIKVAGKEVMEGVLQQRAQKYGHSTDATSPMGLPPPMTEKCTLTHATSIEFLHQFWTAFLSGDPDRAAELQYLAESLKRSSARISAVAEEADKERESVIRQRKQEIRNHFERTGKKIRWKSDMVGGGRDAVLKLMQPVLDALDKAQAEYSRALAAEGIQISTEG
ncbi:RNA polymerase II transcription factor B subunit 1 [Metarhizium acridum]|uniref:RNA polymerase II transcription factor related protein n=1 Tax=Metarhizium acridum (strain CQMa 102) TaxID=655827 RepID=E9EDV2_METAQ|nr:RNA polymerase II transcription factor related protein [Metarhizium acridum CQMa 102]EFY85911.1 RNA polymerase II transcription factor related protein [Metarhizium acridum CQMa 102]KAG8413768.1 RNA polymerase II transcription factor B subunit 1 [Metarhizium acridum]